MTTVHGGILGLMWRHGLLIALLSLCLTLHAQAKLAYQRKTVDEWSCSACQIVVEEVNRRIAASPQQLERVGFRIDPNKKQLVQRGCVFGFCFGCIAK